MSLAELAGAAAIAAIVFAGGLLWFNATWQANYMANESQRIGQEVLTPLYRERYVARIDTNYECLAQGTGVGEVDPASTMTFGTCSTPTIPAGLRVRVQQSSCDPVWVADMRSPSIRTETIEDHWEVEWSAGRESAVIRMRNPRGDILHQREWNAPDRSAAVKSIEVEDINWAHGIGELSVESQDGTGAVVGDHWLRCDGT